MKTNKLENLVVGGGCFWCIEALFNEIKGVEKVVSGYMGGSVPGYPTYREVCSGRTGHAEVVKITYSPSIISLKELIIIFMTNHDPTSLERQGQKSNIASQYRSVVFYENQKQKKTAVEVVKQMISYYNNPIVTEISPVGKFFVAEDYHQTYYENNKEEAYCKAIIIPKIVKLHATFGDKLRAINVC